MVNLTDKNFDNFLQEADKPVLVDFWAVWCSPCSVLSPILEKLAEDNKEKVILAKVDVDTAPAISQKYGINKIPTVILFKKLKPASGFIGVRPLVVIGEWLNKTLGEEILKGEDKEEEKLGEREEKKEKVKKTEEGEKIEKIIKWYEGYAKKNGFNLNPNKETVKGLIKGLLNNEEKYGTRYCPCRRITENLEDDREKICPCKWHKEEIGKEGHCYCGLFFK